MSNLNNASIGAANLKQISQETMDTIAMVTDPYHDKNLRLSGYPDGKTITSAVKRYAEQISINCPFVLESGDTWDFYIFTTPLHLQCQFQQKGTSGYTNSINGSIVPRITLGPLNVYYRHYGPSGVGKGESYSAFGAKARETTPGPTRTVALAYELHNTTAEMFKSGSLTTFRNNVESIRCDYKTMTASPTNISFTNILTLPDTLAQAQMLPNCRTWEAGDGVYSVSLPTPDNPYSSQYFQNLSIFNGKDSPSPVNIWLYSSELETYVPSWSPISTTGTMSSRFSSREVSFILDFRQILEIAPTVRSSVLPYATTAPAHNPVFLKLYKRMFNSIEAGVPVHYNSAGEWFRRIVKLVRDNLSAVTHLLPPQYKALAAAAVPIATTIIDKTILKPKARDTTLKLTATNQRMTHQKKK